MRQQLEELRDIEGAPAGDDAAILKWSLPVEYTACPNPFIAQYLQDHACSSEDNYQREPLASDVSAGKQDAIYRGQVYHTKVPPKAITRYIEHYCPEGGVVFDGFCGSGMTGVAACRTDRVALLNDLSPAATAIAASFCVPADPDRTAQAAAELIARLDEECGWLYEVGGDSGRPAAEVAYVIHSEVYRCPHCGAEAPFAETGFDFETKRPASEVVCGACDREIEANDLERCLDEDGKTVEVPVRTKYADSERGSEREISDRDTELTARIAAQPIPYPFPDHWMMHCRPNEDGWGDMWRRGYHSGVFRVSDFYYKRTLWVLAAALHFVGEMDYGREIRHILRTTVINTSINLTKMRRAYQGVLPLVLYLPRMRRECNAIRTLERSLSRTLRGLRQLPEDRRVIITTQSSTDLRNVPDDSVDYVFTDPPFGQNIIYSEVNFLWESWMGVFTDQQPEAIVSDHQGKGVGEYGGLMEECFAQARRILKPGRWITVVFHNSSNKVWAAIQDALEGAGFIVAEVRTLDKQVHAFKAAVSKTAVKQDLVISAYSPEPGLIEPSSGAEVEQDVWEFVRQRLGELPTPGDDADSNELAERQDYMLYNRMVAQCVLRGVAVPMGSGEFYEGLRERFVEENHLFFVEEQAE